MTEKRFRVVHSAVTQKFVVVDNEHEEIFEGIKNRDNACRFSNLLNALHEENTYLKLELDTHKHPLWSTREAERKVSGKKCHICGKEVRENYYLDKRGYTCYTCSKAIANNRSIIKRIKDGLND